MSAAGEKENQKESSSGPTKPKTLTIHVDRNQFKVERESMTGNELRSLAGVGAEFDLYLVVSGPGDDRLIGDDESASLKNGMHFFTAPRSIAPGNAG